MAELIAQILRYIVEAPDEVKVEVVREDRVITMRISVAPDDVGKVIGREGRIINALRQVVRSAGGGRGRERVNVELAQ